MTSIEEQDAILDKELQDLKPATSYDELPDELKNIVDDHQAKLEGILAESRARVAVAFPNDEE
jgi:hypothetical protein